MYEFTKSIFINRSQQDVFDFLSNPANMPQWQSGVEHAEWTSAGPPDTGSTYKVVVKIPGGKTEALFEIVHWDPPNGYGYKSIKIAFPVKSIELSYTLTPKENGTEVTFKAQIGAAGIIRFLENLFGKQAEKQDSGSVDTAKQLLEAG